MPSTLEIIANAINSLPVLSKDDIPLDDCCPICLIPFHSQHEDHTEVTALSACGHLFCRKDLTEWIRGQHGSCPTCRHVFLDISPPSDSDDESSDGGEYIPPDDIEDEDDDIFPDTDGFSEFQSDIEEVDMDHPDDAPLLEYAGAEIHHGDTDMDSTDGLTDGDSEIMSSFDDLEEEQTPETDPSVSVHEENNFVPDAHGGIETFSDQFALDGPK